jgi:hypothetical protein
MGGGISRGHSKLSKKKTPVTSHFRFTSPQRPLRLRGKLLDSGNHERRESPRNQRRRLKISAPYFPFPPKLRPPSSEILLFISAFRFPNFSIYHNGPPVTDANRRMAENVTC